MADQVTTSLAQAKVLVMEGMSGKAPRINAENNHWEVYDNDTQAWVDTGVSAVNGAPGQDGYTPTISVSQGTNGITVTISDGRPSGTTASYFIPNGTDYVLTNADKQDISAMALPTVTASDNGKFLRVVSGAWAAASVPFQTPRVAMASTDTAPTLDPNKLYVFPEMATLTPTLATPTDNTIVNEYHFAFDSGSTATALTLPASILQPDGFAVEANMHYEISILEGAMTAQGWAVTA